MKKAWNESGGKYYYSNGNQSEFLDNHIFALKRDPTGKYYLELLENEFGFNHKLYGIEEKLITRFIKTYNKRNGNMGALLNGVKGTGKSVTAKLIANQLKQPTILITEYVYNEGLILLSSIQQNITIFADEFEKIPNPFGGTNVAILPLLDGALNSKFKRAFLFTTNTLAVNENLLDRPARIRYLKTFKNLSEDIILEILNDKLENKEFIPPVAQFISELELITIDSVISVIDEVNIHNELPEEFADIFNTKKNKKYEFREEAK